MKKILFSILLILTTVIMPTSVDAKNKVTVYIFRGNTCGHCEEAITYLNEHKHDINEDIEIVTYEVFDNENNYKLQKAVSEKLELTEKQMGSVPLIVIGDEYILGFGSTTYNQIMRTAESYIEDEEYEDIVEEKAKELNLKFDSKTLVELFPEPNKVVTIVVYSIFGAIVLGFAAMIIFSRK